jgi:hypothetical protein
MPKPLFFVLMAAFCATSSLALYAVGRSMAGTLSDNRTTSQFSQHRFRSTG